MDRLKRIQQRIRLERFGKQAFDAHQAPALGILEVRALAQRSSTAVVRSSLSLAGAERITRSAPASMCFWRSAFLVNRPVDSSATWQPSDFHGKFAGSFSVVILMCLPLTMRPVASTSMVPLN